MNNLNAVGNVGSDAEVRFTKEGKTERRIGIYQINFANSIELLFKDDFDQE